MQRSRFVVAAVAAGLGVLSGFLESSRGAVVLYEAATWTCVVLAVLAVRRVEGRARTSWLLVTASLALWALGDLIWDALTLAGSRADASVADVFYLSGYVVFALAVLFLIRRRPAGRREALLDGTAFASATAVVIWLAVVRPQTGSSTGLVTVVLATYPLMDALLVAALLWLVLTPGGDGPAQRLLVVGVAALTVVDAAYATLTQSGHDQWVEYFNACYPLAYALVALAVTYAATTVESDAPSRVSPMRLHPGRALLLGAALVLAPAAAAMSATTEASVDRVVLLVVTCAISIMVLTRFVNEAHARERIHADVLYLASHDPLTGLLNRRAFLGEVESLVTQTPCALIYIDLDGFKWLNDTDGHDAGDDALVKAARRLLDAVRDSDLVARLGGDEFAVCCPDLVDSGAIDAMTERIRATLERIHTGMTASIGVALALPGIGANALLKTADAAMYRAKRAGGNKAWVELTSDALH